MADPLHQCAVRLLDQAADGAVAALAVVAADFHLDQFVTFQHLVQFGQERRSDAFATDLQQGFEVVRQAAQEAVLGRGQKDRHVSGSRVGRGDQGIMVALFARPSMATRSKSSQRWLREHFADPFVKKAQAEGMRSRAAYKLEELLQRDRLLKPDMVVVDLGAAPGGWSQQVRKSMGDRGRVLALDILEMPPLAGVEFLHGDFREETVLSQLEAMLGETAVDLVLSDMAPNKSGMDAVDQPRMMHLAELAMAFADSHLKPNGAFLIKLFQGVGFDDYIRAMRRRYEKVTIRKPAASRKRSPEVYALGQGKRTQIK